MGKVFALLLALFSAAVPAQEVRVPVCFNYSCVATETVAFDAALLEQARGQLLAASDPATERAVLAAVVGRLYREAGVQTPVGADRAGNYFDQGVDGRMDCIDHSTNTTRFLKLIEARDMLRFHRVLEPARRTRFVLQHFSAVVEEVEPPVSLRPAVVVPDHVPLMLALCDCAEVLDDVPAPAPIPDSRPGERFVIDSWFVDNGEAAIVLSLADWLDGDGPNVQ
ncbi:hypothetical protein CEW83_10065 [Parazoarcus communis]|uniref:Uncharacterized protein n=1 Tax=Parazoarcus communis TaxID=41977 RepID=A0A2U8GPE0_9RHOO|nr:hypothetical protein [Parazoarcus communis]AWI75512.1 hypothetical protein CEW83_10065 [Parazoarcus communis]